MYLLCYYLQGQRLARDLLDLHNGKVRCCEPCSGAPCRAIERLEAVLQGSVKGRNKNTVVGVLGTDDKAARVLNSVES